MRQASPVFDEVDSGSTIVHVSAADRTSSSRRISVQPGTPNVTAIYLAALDERTIHQASKGGAIAEYQRFGAVFPRGSLGDSTEPIPIRHIFVDSPSVFVPPATLLDADDTQGPLEIYAAFYLDDPGVGLDLLTEPGTVRLNKPADFSDGGRADFAVYQLDPDEGLWVYAGAAEETETYLQGAFDTAGWWALGAPALDSGCRKRHDRCADGRERGAAPDRRQPRPHPCPDQPESAEFLRVGSGGQHGEHGRHRLRPRDDHRVHGRHPRWRRGSGGGLCRRRLREPGNLRGRLL